LFVAFGRALAPDGSSQLRSATAEGANSFDVTTSTAAVTDWAPVVPAHAGIEALPITKLEITAAALIFRIFMIAPLQHFFILDVSQFSLANNQLLSC